MTNIAIAGAGGRMGRAIAEQVRERDDIRITGALVRPGSEHEDRPVPGLSGPNGTADPEAAVAGADVVLDFSVPEAAPEVARAAAAAGAGLVVGITGLDTATRRSLEAFGEHIPVLFAPNTSLGVNLLAGLVRRAAALLGEEYDIEILEAHHRHKADAPSGTALRLGEAAAQGRGIDADDRADHDRHGRTGPRKPGDIGYAVIRGGDIAGEHNVIFAGPGERLELGHRASSRATFAAGAVHCAVWTARQAPGRYSMDDVLDLGPGA